ncbi:HNH endonuclease [Aminipila butyrica]|uniref:HNH endonuclease n=1 Tax=Aminipila butyrica TaxID=433296 RepID=A0A858BYT8_9FIRM|nr:HNH endonuclease signature motif containing protein [Aminipila butyrica]QIB70278.1 HNH endonuclease [Aminipila butyrica]
MIYREKPHFVIKKNLQKSKQTGVYFSDIATPDILKDVCHRIANMDEFTYEYVDNEYSDEFLPKSYNKGRMAIMQYKDSVDYITFSEKEIGGRNSSVQSVPTAFNIYYSNPHPNKRLFYYFLNVKGNAETDYQILMYRLMHTVGCQFLNADAVLSAKIGAYTSVEDIMFNRRINTGKNRSNNSTYITKSGPLQIDIYGKTYGANKYETSMICYALSMLRKKEHTITLYEILEGDLKELPEASLNVIRSMGAIEIVATDRTLEKKVFEENNSLRSPSYIYNLGRKLGEKHCTFCNCEIPSIIQGAHIWPVAEIKKEVLLSFDEKLTHATNGENGLWLCENHHKLFDDNILRLNKNGQLYYADGIEANQVVYLDEITKVKQLKDEIMTTQFEEYIRKRNKAI